MRLRLGIAEIDSYNMLFYGHYLRHSERAANSCLGRESTSATVSHVALAKYVSSVSWNDVVDIRTTAHPSEDGTLLHEWFVNERYDTPVHVCLCSYDVDGPAGFVGARTPDAGPWATSSAWVPGSAGSAEGGGRKEAVDKFDRMA